MARQKKVEEQIEPKKPTKVKDYIFAVGRRREAVARVRLYEKVDGIMSWGEHILKAGEMLVNNRPIDKYFGGKVSEVAYMEPLRTTNTIGKYAITIRVVGGGPSGQLDAAILGISRALEKFDREAHRPILKKKGFLTRDARIRERRKVGTGGKARRAKQSPKR